jgi:flagellar hook assembly protein FlgD
MHRLTLRDVQGRLVRRLTEGWFPAGSRIVAWDGRDDAGMCLPAGIYLATLEIAGRVASRRVTLLP